MNKPARILIVDDEPNVRFVFRMALETADYAVSEEGDGPAALAHLRAGRADLVLLDLRMPGLDGMEVLRRLRDAGDDVPVVVTAHGNIPDVVAVMKRGATDFLPKPVTPAGLREVVSAVLARRDFERPGPVMPGSGQLPGCPLRRGPRAGPAGAGPTRVRRGGILPPHRRCHHARLRRGWPPPG